MRECLYWTQNNRHKKKHAKTRSNDRNGIEILSESEIFIKCYKNETLEIKKE